MNGVSSQGHIARSGISELALRRWVCGGRGARKSSRIRGHISINRPSFPGSRMGHRCLSRALGSGPPEIALRFAKFELDTRVPTAIFSPAPDPKPRAGSRMFVDRHDGQSILREGGQWLGPTDAWTWRKQWAVTRKTPALRGFQVGRGLDVGLTAAQFPNAS